MAKWVIDNSGLITRCFVVSKENQYYIAISGEAFEYNSKTYYCISIKSPIGSLLFGKKTGDIVVFNDRKIEVLEIL